MNRLLNKKEWKYICEKFPDPEKILNINGVSVGEKKWKKYVKRSLDNTAMLGAKEWSGDFVSFHNFCKELNSHFSCNDCS